MTQIYQNNSPVFIKVLNKKGIVKDYDSTLNQYFITYFNSKDKRESNWFTLNQLAEFKNKDIHARSSSGDRLVRFDKKESIQKTLSDGRKLYYEDSDKMVMTTKETKYPVLELHNQKSMEDIITSIKESSNVIGNSLKNLTREEINHKMWYSDPEKLIEWYNEYVNDGKLRTEYEFKILEEIENNEKLHQQNKKYKNYHNLMLLKEELMNYVKSGRPLFQGHKPNHINIIKPESEYVKWVTQKVGEKEPEGFLPLHLATREEEYIAHIKSLEKLVEGYKLVLSSLQNEKDSFKMVREFQQTFNLPAPDVPTVLSETTVVNRSGWLVEEVLELLWSTADSKDQFTSMYGELLIRMDKDFNKLFNKPFEPHNKLINQADALTDIDYFNLGTFVELGIVPNSLTRIVHSANMAKLHNGKVVYNDNNKVVKPEGWVAPEPLIEKEIERQVELGAKRFK